MPIFIFHKSSASSVAIFLPNLPASFITFCGSLADIPFIFCEIILAPFATLSVGVISAFLLNSQLVNLALPLSAALIKLGDVPFSVKSSCIALSALPLLYQPIHPSNAHTHQPIIFSVAVAFLHSLPAVAMFVVTSHCVQPTKEPAKPLNTGLDMAFVAQNPAHHKGNVGTVDSAILAVVSPAENALLDGSNHCLLKLASSSHFTNSWKPCTFSLALSAHTKSNAHDTKLVPKVLTACLPIPIR